MGGGVGLSVHAPIRIATENTVFAMPETGIGFFPDVGGSFFLPRILEGFTGVYLGLLGKVLDGVEAYYAGLATHYLDSSVLGNLTARLGELVFRDFESLAERLKTIDRTIEEFSTGIPHGKGALMVGEMRRAIDRCFCHDTIEQIIEALEKEKKERAAAAAPIREWAEQTLNTLHEKSPTFLKVTLRQLQLGRRWDIAETFQREHHIASRAMFHPDFVNGVTARLISKPRKPAVWQPASLHEVSSEDVDHFFDVPEGATRLELEEKRGLGNYKKYPFRSLLGLPREEEVERMVGSRRVGRRELVEAMVKGREGKVGVREKVEEVRERCCSVDGEGKLVWEGEMRKSS